MAKNAHGLWRKTHTNKTDLTILNNNTDITMYNITYIRLSACLRISF